LQKTGAREKKKGANNSKTQNVGESEREKRGWGFNKAKGEEPWVDTREGKNGSNLPARLWERKWGGERVNPKKKKGLSAAISLRAFLSIGKKKGKQAAAVKIKRVGSASLHAGICPSSRSLSFPRSAARQEDNIAQRVSDKKGKE